MQNQNQNQQQTAINTLVSIAADISSDTPQGADTFPQSILVEGLEALTPNQKIVMAAIVLLESLDTLDRYQVISRYC